MLVNLLTKSLEELNLKYNNILYNLRKGIKKVNGISNIYTYLKEEIMWQMQSTFRIEETRNPKNIFKNIPILQKKYWNKYLIFSIEHQGIWIRFLN